MPLSKRKGAKGRKKGGNQEATRALTYKEEGQEYAQVTRMLGNGRVEAYCFDGKTRQCRIRGQMMRRVWIGVNDVILVSLREYEEDKADVIMKYTADEVTRLKKAKEIPERLQNEEKDENKDVAIRFGAGDQEDDEDDRGPRDFISDDEDEEEEGEEEEEYEVPPQNRVYTLDDL